MSAPSLTTAVTVPLLERFPDPQQHPSSPRSRTLNLLQLALKSVFTRIFVPGTPWRFANSIVREVLPLPW